MSSNYKKITTNDSVINIINHPAFAGFGQYIFPWDDRVYDGDMTMGQISSLCHITAILMLILQSRR